MELESGWGLKDAGQRAGGQNREHAVYRGKEGRSGGPKGGGPKGGGRRVGAERWGPKVGAKISRFFFPLPTLFLFFSFQFPWFFVELRWSLRVSINENLFGTHKFGVQRALGHPRR